MKFLCCVCDNRAEKNSIFCKDCEIIYAPVQNEAWFIELSELMKRQRRIDDIEKYSIYDVHSNNFQERFKRERGRPKTSMVVEELVKGIRGSVNKVSIRHIEDMCKKLGIDISRETIRRILTQK